jgi:hypothetical protein
MREEHLTVAKLKNTSEQRSRQHESNVLNRHECQLRKSQSCKTKHDVQMF